MPADMAGPATGVIHDLGYRRYDGPRLGRGAIIMALCWHSLRSAFGLGRGFKAKIVPMLLLAIMCLPAVVNAVALAVSPGSPAPIHYDTYLPGVRVLIMTIFLAAQAPELVSRDLRSHVLPLYFARPMRRDDYPLAKLAACILACLIMLEVPEIILYLGSVLQAHGGHDIWAQTRAFIPGLLVAFMWAVLLAAIGLVLASLSGRRAYATGIIAIFFFLTFTLAGLLRGIAEANHGGFSNSSSAPGGAHLAGLVSPFTVLDGVRQWLGGTTEGIVPHPTGFYGPLYGLMLLVFLAAAVAGLVYPVPEGRRRVNVIEVRNVTHWYGNVVAINDVTMTVGPGVTGLLGPNGAGKSTLLHMMAGFLQPSRGELTVGGAAAWRNPALFNTVGLVPEHASVYAFLTGSEFVRATAKLHRLPDPAAAARRAISVVEMDGAEDRKIGTYSKGMRQRIKVAAALVHDPQVILLDEPFNGMDPRQRLHMMDLLHRLAEDGRAILFSSHILEEVERLSGTIQVMVAGRLAASGDFRAIRRLMTSRPHVFVLRTSDDRAVGAALIGRPSVTGVELTPGGLQVQASDYGTFTRELAGLTRDAGIRLREVLPADESLESVFSYLIAT